MHHGSRRRAPARRVGRTEVASRRASQRSHDVSRCRWQRVLPALVGQVVHMALQRCDHEMWGSFVGGCCYIGDRLWEARNLFTTSLLSWRNWCRARSCGGDLSRCRPSRSMGAGAVDKLRRQRPRSPSGRRRSPCKPGRAPGDWHGDHPTKSTHAKAQALVAPRSAVVRAHRRETPARPAIEVDGYRGRAGAGAGATAPLGMPRHRRRDQVRRWSMRAPP